VEGEIRARVHGVHGSGLADVRLSAHASHRDGHAPAAAASTVSGHLTDLRRSGLVVERKVGKLVLYSIDGDGPFSAWVRATLALVGDDAHVREDAALIRKVQAVPIPALTRGGLSLDDIRRRRAGRRAVPAVARD